MLLLLLGSVHCNICFIGVFTMYTHIIGYVALLDMMPQQLYLGFSLLSHVSFSKTLSSTNKIFSQQAISCWALKFLTFCPIHNFCKSSLCIHVIKRVRLKCHFNSLFFFLIYFLTTSFYLIK